ALQPGRAGEEHPPVGSDAVAVGVGEPAVEERLVDGMVRSCRRPRSLPWRMRITRRLREQGGHSPRFRPGLRELRWRPATRGYSPASRWISIAPPIRAAGMR